MGDEEVAVILGSRFHEESRRGSGESIEGGGGNRRNRQTKKNENEGAMKGEKGSKDLLFWDFGGILPPQ